MMANEKSNQRISILETVTNPLGFFVLVVLVVEAGIIGLAATVGNGTTPYLYSIVGLLVLLIIVVALIAVFRPEALSGNRHEPIRNELAENIARDVYDVLDGYLDSPQAAFSQLHQSCIYLANNRNGAEKHFVERFSETIKARANINLGLASSQIGHIDTPTE